MIGLFGIVVGLGASFYSLWNPDRDLQMLSSILAVGFFLLSFLFLLRIAPRFFLFKGSKERDLRKLKIGVIGSILVDILILTLGTILILWTGVYKWTILIVFSVILILARLITIFKFIRELQSTPV